MKIKSETLKFHQKEVRICWAFSNDSTSAGEGFDKREKNLVIRYFASGLSSKIKMSKIVYFIPGDS